ncbi:MAG: aminoacetone oxidase family FAD-binding enzyme [Firmicutes bacterium]|nr:aminoacetone oxidase family FAD-binding enzyme [Bacillota bacterium]
MIDICIVGGGAAGMTAAIYAKEANPALRVCIIEKKNQLGKKILASGNGKCNLSNLACEKVDETLLFFQSLGVITRADSEGRLYPYTEESRAVQEALRHKLNQLGVEIRTSMEVLEIEKRQHFVLHLKNGSIEANRVLVACGGKAGPQFGTTGDGYRWAKAFGHKVEKPIPVLTAVDLKENVERLAGIRVKASVALHFKNREIFCEKGEVQFTKTGISGICIFNLSRYLLIPEGRSFVDGFDDYRIYVDFFPDMEKDAVEELLHQRQAMGFNGETLLEYLVRGPVADWICALSKGSASEAASLLKAFPLSPKGAKGWDFAQATKGGVSLTEICPDTMESRIVKGLYFAGEVLDFDGPCGGYNLQNAWETGAKAGREMAR